MFNRACWMVGVVVGSVSLNACGGAAAPEETASACAPLTSEQGLSLNGMWANGMWANGMWANGMWANGVSSQGVSAQGIQPQGLQAQGLTYQGIGVQGVTSQGLTSQGLSAQGFSGQGITAQGVNAQGIEVVGPIRAEALSGLAFRGVTEADAAAWIETGSTIPAENVLVLDYEAGVLGASSLDGARLSPPELVGALLPFGTSAGGVAWLTISEVSTHPDAADLPLYSLTTDGENVCGDGIGGLFVPGIWDETGARHDETVSGETRIDTTFSCTTGVIAKCVAWGYRPWTQGAVIHEACTRMARADYCGDGVPHTQNGTLIDMYDKRGIQTEVPDDGMTFEAAWGPDGAVCVREPRYLDRSKDGDIVYPSCWAELPHCEDFAAASELGAELGNNSQHLSRELSCTP